MPTRSKKIRPYWVPKREKHQRLVDNSQFYNSTKWRITAKRFKESNPLCVHCSRDGRVGPADVADHIRGLNIIIEQGGDPYSWDELQPLCNKCHNKKSGRESKNKK